MSNPSTSDADLGKLALSKEQTERALTETIYKSLYNDLDLQILELEKQSEEYAHNSRISSLKTQYAQAEENNNGTGYKIIYAEYDGIVSGFPVDERTKVDVGKKLLETVTYFDDVIRVGAQGSVTEKTGYSYTITVKDDTYKADVICGNQYMLPHIFTEDGKVYGTTTKIDASNFYIRPEADFLKLSSQFLTLEASMDSLRLENMLIVPGEYVFKEKSFDDEIYHYVWVKDGDLVYKQYVITGLEDRIGEKIGDENKTIILSGLSVGDTIVK